MTRTARIAFRIVLCVFCYFSCVRAHPSVSSHLTQSSLNSPDNVISDVFTFESERAGNGKGDARFGQNENVIHKEITDNILTPVTGHSSGKTRNKVTNSDNPSSTRSPLLSGWRKTRVNSGLLGGTASSVNSDSRENSHSSYSENPNATLVWKNVEQNTSSKMHTAQEENAPISGFQRRSNSSSPHTPRNIPQNGNSKDISFITETSSSPVKRQNNQTEAKQQYGVSHQTSVRPKTFSLGLDAVQNNVQGHETDTEQEDSLLEEYQEETNEYDTDFYEDYECQLHTVPCSPFFGSPCDDVDKVNVKPFLGNCSDSWAKANKRWKPCGGAIVPGRNISSACYCFRNAASCCANLTAIPDLSIDNKLPVYYLNFTSNNITNLDQHTLSNVTLLRWLILSRNNISRIDEDTFTHMDNLTRLELAYNRRYLNPHMFKEAINRASLLRTLDINNTHFDSPKSGMDTGTTWVIKHLNLTQLKQLFVAGGKKKHFYLSDLNPARLPSLCSFAISSHFLEKVYCCSKASLNDSDLEDDDPDSDDTDTYTDLVSCISPRSKNESFCQNFSLPNLQLLNLANNSLVHPPSFCRPGNVSGTWESVVPGLQAMSLSINAILNPHPSQFHCLNNLSTLALTGNPLKVIPANAFQAMGSLKHLDLRFTNVMQAAAFAFNHTTLQSLTIKSSNWFMDKKHEACCIDSGAFKGTRLEVVELSYNVFKYTKRERVNDILFPLRTVRELLMAGVGLSNIPDVVQNNFTSLEVLGFKSNSLASIPQEAFDNMPKLQYLDVSDNDLTTPNAEVFRYLIEEKNVHINMESNPLSCTCDLLAFYHLYMGHRDIRRPGDTVNSTSNKKGMFVGHHYNCFAPAHLTHLKRPLLEEIQLTVHMCLLTDAQEILIYIICLLLILSILIYTLLYRYRWQVRFWLYKMHMRMHRPPTHITHPLSRPRFNVFVSYCKADSHFVINQILPALERNNRLPLCIHERDFIPGRYISQNVVERMEESRHVLLILSNAFLQNDWCRFELYVAQKYGLVHRQIPVTTLRLEELRMELMDPNVISVLQATQGMEWPGRQCSPQDLNTFWSRLAQKLGVRYRPARSRQITGGRPHERRQDDSQTVPDRVERGQCRNDGQNRGHAQDRVGQNMNKPGQGRNGTEQSGAKQSGSEQNGTEQNRNRPGQSQNGMEQNGAKQHRAEENRNNERQDRKRVEQGRHRSSVEAGECW